MLFSCGKSDLIRYFFATIIVAGLIYFLEWILPADPEEMVIDNMYLYGVIAGVVSYLLGKSRRNAFISCLFGVTVAQLVQWVINFSTNQKSILGLGVGGAFSTYIVAIIISVALCEFIGRCVECATIQKEKKEYNFETHSYDSEKNGKLSKNLNNKEHRIKNIENANSVKILRNNNKKTQKDTKLSSGGAKNEV
jgi:hypothetical protein